MIILHVNEYSILLCSISILNPLLAMPLDLFFGTLTTTFAPL